MGTLYNYIALTEWIWFGILQPKTTEMRNARVDNLVDWLPDV